jgi:hypothetical protein
VTRALILLAVHTPLTGAAVFGGVSTTSASGTRSASTILPDIRRIEPHPTP